MTMQMNNIGKKLKLENCFALSCNGKSGGLAILWNFETTLQQPPH